MTATIDSDAGAAEGAVRPAPAAGGDGASPKTAKTRETVAQRLLLASIDHSYDPVVDIDWAAEPKPGLMYLPEHRVSLYGTPMWDRLSPEQRIELSKHEISSAMQVGLWFELILMQMLLRYAYDLDPRTSHAQYALCEIGDETRHSTMFARAADKLETPSYAPGRKLHNLARVYKSVSSGPAMFAPVLVAEEILDRIQRELMDDENIQPLIRTVSRIHVIEEARHVRYARDELSRQMPELSPAARRYHQSIIGLVSYLIVDGIIDPRVYASVGISPREGRAAALQNPHHQQTRRWALGKIMPFLLEVGAVGGPTTALLRRGHML